jgi:hypothetical protein
MVITVWNMGRGRESSIPWTVFYNGEDITSKVREVSPRINGRLDIRIGIVPEVPVMTSGQPRSTVIRRKTGNEGA